jgi:hypothetical protein
LTKYEKKFKIYPYHNHMASHSPAEQHLADNPLYLSAIPDNEAAVQALPDADLRQFVTAFRRYCAAFTRVMTEQQDPFIRPDEQTSPWDRPRTPSFGEVEELRAVLFAVPQAPTVGLRMNGIDSVATGFNAHREELLNSHLRHLRGPDQQQDTTLVHNTHTAHERLRGLADRLNVTELFLSGRTQLYSVMQNAA